MSRLQQPHGDKVGKRKVRVGSGADRTMFQIRKENGLKNGAKKENEISFHLRATEEVITKASWTCAENHPV